MRDLFTSDVVMKQPMVVGYKGEIGSFLLHGLLEIMPKALDIWCVDINESAAEVRQRIRRADTIFLCVPLEDTVGWLWRHKKLLMGKVIVEQCSLKEWLYEEGKLNGLDIRSMHVLFRPSQTPNPDDRRVGLFEGQFNQTLAKNIGEMTRSQVVWYKDAQEHDREMAVQQALLHRTLLVMGKLLKECSGSTFISKRTLELSERIKKGKLDLYRKIQENRYLPARLDEMKKEFDNFNIEAFWPC